MTYDAVLFDNDGVLVEPPGKETMQAAVRASLERTGLDADPGAVFRAFAGGDVASLAERCRECGVDVATFCQRAATAAFEAQRREVEAGLRSAYDDAAALRALDRPLGLVSDNQPGFVEFLLGRFGLADLFDTVRCRTFSPHGLRRRKPDPSNLRAALADLAADAAVDSGNVLHVGDTAADDAAATRIGLDSALLDRPGDDDPTAAPATRGIERVDPDYRIEGLDELPALVE